MTCLTSCYECTEQSSVSLSCQSYLLAHPRYNGNHTCFSVELAHEAHRSHHEKQAQQEPARMACQCSVHCCSEVGSCKREFVESLLTVAWCSSGKLDT